MEKRTAVNSSLSSSDGAYSLENGRAVRKMADIRKQFDGEARDSRFSGNADALFSQLSCRNARLALAKNSLRSFAPSAPTLRSKGLLARATSEFFYVDV